MVASEELKLKTVTEVFFVYFLVHNLNMYYVCQNRCVHVCVCIYAHTNVCIYI